MMGYTPKPIDSIETSLSSDSTVKTRGPNSSSPTIRPVVSDKVHNVPVKRWSVSRTVEEAKHKKYHDNHMAALVANGTKSIVARANKKNRTRRNTMMGVKAGTEVVHGRVQLENDQVEELRNIFHLLDKDMDGLLQEDQLLTALATVGVTPTRRIKFELKKRLPRKKNGSGKPDGVGFETFMRIIRSTLLAQPAAVTEIDALAALYESPDRPGVIKGYQLRHLLEGVQTSSKTTLSVDETDMIFNSLGIMEDADVNVHQYVDTVSDGFIRVIDHRRIGDSYRNKITKKVKDVKRERPDRLTD
jgi:Ca2+-binding EF-hand superfamily protein